MPQRLGGRQLRGNPRRIERAQETSEKSQPNPFAQDLRRHLSYYDGARQAVARQELQERQGQRDAHGAAECG